ncbi:MAG: hypothetical protein EON59_10845, partial [Alphaproteobacteria bacterium]
MKRRTTKLVSVAAIMAVRHKARSYTRNREDGFPVPTGEPRTLLVAATGGHLMQLTRLVRRIELAGRPLWVTFDAPQSRSLLEGQEVHYVRFTAPRDYLNVLRNVGQARSLFR